MNSFFVFFQSESDYKKLVQRTPKKVTSLTSRDQLKTMVGDLEKEISEMLLTLRKHENDRIKLEEELKKLKENSDLEKALKDLEDINKKYDLVQKQLDAEKDRKANSDDLNKTVLKTKENLEKANEEKKKLKEQIDKLNKDYSKSKEDKKILDEELSTLKTSLSIKCFE